MTIWVFVWLWCAGIAIFGGEGEWTTGRKLAAFLAVGIFLAAVAAS